MKQTGKILFLLFLVFLTAISCGTVTSRNMKMYPGNELPESKISKIKCTNCNFSHVDGEDFGVTQRIYRLYAKNVSVLPGTHELKMTFGKGEFGCNSGEDITITTEPGRTYKIYTKTKCKSIYTREVEKTWVWVKDVDSDQIIYGSKP